jgi:hypothetical protein
VNTDAPIDFLAGCVPATTGNPILEQVRDRGANAALALYRLVKTAMVHSADNQALLQTATQSQEVLSDFAAAIGNSVSITFAGDSVFANGQLVRASRKVYELLWDLRKLLQKCEVSEVVIDPLATPHDLLGFAALTATCLRDPARRGALLSTTMPNVAVRKIEPVLQRSEREEDFELRERIVRFYASSLLVMRRFFDDVAQGITFLPFRAKRVSQRLVTLSETNDPTLLGLMTMTHAHRDDAGRALQTAILAVVLAREITTDRVALSRLAMAALVADCGRVRLAGKEGRDRFVPLGDTDNAAVPAATSAVNIATGGVNVASAFRTVVCNETTWMEREALLGPLYNRQKNSLAAARILRLVRAVLDRLAPRDTSAPMTPTDAIAEVATLPDVDPVLVRLLVKAFGLIPVGSVVELDTGEWAVVLAPSSDMGALDRPRIKVLTDRQGKALTHPVTLELDAPAAARALPRISHIIPPAQVKFNVTRAFLV